MIRFCALSLLISIPAVMAVKPLGDFAAGQLTFFGGKPDGMDPGSPSYGTKEGRLIFNIFFY
jgi:hypothetical protein